MELGKKEETKALMDSYMENFPESKFPWDLYMIPYAELYYQLGEPEKGNQIVERLAETYGQDLDYYNSVDASVQGYYDQDIRTALSVLRDLGRVAQNNGQKELGARLDSSFMQRMQFQSN